MAVDLKDKAAVLARVKAHLRLRRMTVSQICTVLGYAAKQRSANKTKRSRYWQKVRSILDADLDLHSRTYDAESIDVLYSLTPFNTPKLIAAEPEIFISQFNPATPPHLTLMPTAAQKRIDALRAVLTNLPEVAKPTRRKVATLAQVAESWLYLPEARAIKDEIDAAIAAEMERRKQAREGLIAASEAADFLRKAQDPDHPEAAPVTDAPPLPVEAETAAPGDLFLLEQELAVCQEAIEDLRSKMANLEVSIASRAAYRDALRSALEARRAIGGPIKPV